MAVENAEAPGGEHQQARAGKQNAHDADGELALGAVEAGRDGVDQPGRGQHAGQHQRRGGQRQNGTDGAGHAAGLLFVAFGQQAGVNRNERGREYALAEQVLQEIGDAEGGVEGVGGVREAEVMGEDALADEADQAAEQDAGADQRGVTAGGC
jgi:hypothetical protein